MAGAGRAGAGSAQKLAFDQRRWVNPGSGAAEVGEGGEDIERRLNLQRGGSVKG